MERVIAYVDGSSLRSGLKSLGWDHYDEINVHRLAQNLIRPDAELVKAYYFISRLSQPLEARKRQEAYLEKLDTIENLSIVYGKIILVACHCQRCRKGGSEYIPREVGTDVNIAVAIISDAFMDRFDTALLISGDASLAPVARSINESLIPKQLVVAFPPHRFSHELREATKSWRHIGKSSITKSVIDFQAQ